MLSWPSQRKPDDSTNLSLLRRVIETRSPSQTTKVTHEQSWVLIIDYGSQVTQLIARRVRECSIYAEVVPYQKADDALSAPNAASIGAVILSGGPDSVLRDGSPDLPKAFDELEVPVLAICYGQQLLMKNYGGSIGAGEKHPPWSPEHFALVVGKTTFGGCSCSDLLPDGG